MTIQELFELFYQTLNGKYVEAVDKNARDQCVDLAITWVDAMGAPRSVTQAASPMAYMIYTNATTATLKEFDRIPNTPEGVPQVGDIVIWKSEFNGGAGHVGIAAPGCTVNNLVVFSQNYSIEGRCTIDNYDYSNVWGWLRYKNYKAPVQQDIKTPSEKKAIEDWDNTVKVLHSLGLISSPAREKNTASGVLKAIEMIKNRNRFLEDENTKLSSKFKTLELTEANLQNEVKNLQATISNHGQELLKAREDCEKALDALREQYKKDIEAMKDIDYESEIADLKLKVQRVEDERNKYRMTSYLPFIELLKSFLRR